MDEPDWQPIRTAPCDDTWAWVRWKDGGEGITDMDHDSDPTWWAARGATHWRLPTEAEMDVFWKRIERTDQGNPPVAGG